MNLSTFGVQVLAIIHCNTIMGRSSYKQVEVTINHPNLFGLRDLKDSDVCANKFCDCSAP